MKKTWVFRCIGLLLFTISLVLFSGNSSEVHAATSYTDASEYYFSADIRSNRAEVYGGSIYVGNRGKTASSSSSLKYRTIGWDITLSAGGRSLTVSVARDGNYLRTVSAEDLNGYSYQLYCIDKDVLRNLALSRESSTAEFLFSHSKIDITMDAIMTTVSGSTPNGYLTENGDGTVSPGKTVYRLIDESNLNRLWAMFNSSLHTFEGYFNVELDLYNYSLTVYYNANGGTVSSPYSIGTFAGASNMVFSSGNILNESKTLYQTINLYNDTTLGLSRTGYHLDSGKEWTFSGRVFNQNYDYNTSDINSNVKYKDDNAVMTANWQPNTYYIKYDANGGKGSLANTTLTYDTTGNIRTNTFSRTGYKLKAGAEWNTQANGKGTSYSNNQAVSNLTSTNGATITLYAQWEPCEYKITTYKDGGTGGNDAFYELYNNYYFNSEDTKGTAISSIEVPTKTGHIFNGYFTGINGLGTQIVDVDGNIKVGNTYYLYNSYVYASWTPKEYTVTFDKQGGTMGTDSAIVRYNETYPSADAPTKMEYTFKGYYSQPDGNGEMYYTENMAPLKRHTIDSDITLYAKWVDEAIPRTSIEVSTINWTREPNGIDVVGKATDKGSGLDYAELYCGNTKVAEKRDLNGANTVELTAVHKEEGIFRYRIVAYDLAGNKSETYENVKYDITAPEAEGETPGKDETQYEYTLENEEATVENLSNFTIQLFVTDYKYDWGSGSEFGAYYADGSFIPWSTLVKKGIVKETEIPFGAFAGIEGDGLVKIVMSNKVTRIGESAFEYCTDLEEVVFSSRLEQIDDYAFVGCTSLKSAEIPDTVGRIGNYAFSECSSLTSVNIPSSLTVVNTSAFYNCTSLEEIVIPEGVTTIDAYAFYGCNSVTSISLPESFSYSFDCAFPEGFWLSTTTGDVYTESELPYGVADTYVRADEYFMLVKGSEFNATIPATATSVVFTDAVAPSGVSLTDVSKKQNGNIVAWLEGTTYYVSTQCGIPVFANVDSSTMFKSQKNLTSIEFNNFDTSYVENMSEMFCDALSLVELDLSDWNTSRVTNLFRTFGGSNPNVGVMSLETINVSGWDTRNVTDMSRTFQLCVYLTDIIGLEDWRTPNVTTMKCTFYVAVSLEYLDLSEWDMSKVTNTSYMFASYISGDIEYIPKLVSIGDTSNWDLSNVETSRTMFQWCTDLQELNTSNWKMSKNKDMSYMFFRCYSLTSLGDTSNWNAKLNEMTQTFTRCESLVELDLSGLDVSKVKTFAFLFSNCISLEYLNVSNWNTSNVEDFSAMFQVSDGVSALKAIEGIETWDTSNGKSFVAMFYRMSLEELYIPNFDTRNADPDYVSSHIVTDDPDSIPSISTMFKNMYYLKKLTVGENFSTTGNGNCDPVVLPTPSSEYITGADGNWYNEATGEAYLPDAIPTLTAATYVAVNPNAVEGVQSGFYQNGELVYTWDELIENGMVKVDGSTLTYAWEGEYSEIIGDLVIDSSITIIDDLAFDSYMLLNSVTIPDSVVYVGAYAFAGLGYSVEGYNPMSATVYYTGTEEQWNNIEFFDTYYDEENGWWTDNTFIMEAKEIILNASYDPNGNSAGAYYKVESCSNWIPEVLIFNPWEDFVERDIVSDTEIYDLAFYMDDSLVKFIIPEGVMNIGNEAFRECSSLIYVDMPESLETILISAFQDCYNLESIVIPEGVTTIYDYAFSGCYNLESIVIPEGVTTIYDYAFSGCYKLSEITLPSTLEWYYYAFPSPSSDYIDGADGLWYNEDGVGYNAKDIPTGVAATYYAVNPNPTTEINVDISTPGIWYTDGTFISWSDAITEGLYGISETEVSDDGFSYQEDFYAVVIPEGVTYIGSYAFEGCSNLYKVFIPSTVTEILLSTFRDCSSLEEVILPHSLTYIANGAFNECSSLKTLYIPNSVTEIGAYVFQNCDNLTTIYYSGTDTSWQDTNNWGATNATVIGQEAGIWYTDGTFVDWETLKDYGDANDNFFFTTEPENVKAVVHPETSTWVSGYNDCINLEYVYIPNSVHTLYTDVFDANTSLKYVDFESGSTLSLIDFFVFRDCKSLETIYIPDTESTIESDAFDGCNNLKYIYYDGSYVENAPWGAENAVVVRNGVMAGLYKEDGTLVYSWKQLENYGLDIERDTDGGHKGNDGYCFCCLSSDGYVLGDLYSIKTKVIVRDGISKIGASQFDSCSNVISITIPNTVTSIGSEGFYGCSNLTDITYLGTKSQWNSISLGEYWNDSCPEITVHCTDGDIIY